MDNFELLRLFEGLSDLFRAQYYKPLWKKYDYLNDPMNATKLFLEGYAFERSGRSPAFAPAAIEAIKRTENSKDFPLMVWDNFCDLLDDKGLNTKLNPLYPKYPLYHPTNSCNCIWCVLNFEKDFENIITSSKQALEKGQIKDAWEKLNKIQGIGPKIASLFLRDIAITYEDNFTPFAENRWLLQPIDIWVHRIVVALNKKSMSKGTKYKDVAQWIVENCSKPENCNQGMWYFGAKIAKTEFRLIEYLEDPQASVELHFGELKANAQAILEMKTNW